MHSNELIRTTRRKHGMTQREFADFLGIPLHIVMQWEGEVYSPPMYVASLIGRIFDLAEGVRTSYGFKNSENESDVSQFSARFKAGNGMG